jgi:hypothetical protein
MSRKWLSIIAVVAVATLLLIVSSCGDPQELVTITVNPSTETIGASNIQVTSDQGIAVQLQALGTYIHPPVVKDITDQVTWTSNTPQLVTVNSTGLMVATGQLCGGGLVSASVTTNHTSSGVSSSGAAIIGYMNADVVCFTGNGSGGSGGSEPVLTVNFSGSGTGVVGSSTSGFTCSSTNVSCVDSFPSGTSITLTANPVSPSTFGGWSGGGCTGTGTCTLFLQTDTTVVATFN